MDSSRITGPRIYFDAAVYLNWADGKNAAELQEVRGLIRRSRAQVILSVGHLIDFERAGSAESQSRLDALIDDLPGKTFAMGDVREDERRAVDAFLRTGVEPSGLPDLRLDAVESIAPIRSGWLGSTSRLLGGLATTVALAENWAKEGSRPMLDRKSAADFSAAFSIVCDDLEGFFGGFAEPTVAVWLATNLRTAVARNGGEPAELARALAKGHGVVCDASWASTVGGEDRWRKAAARYAPGLLLEAVLRGNRARDGARRALASDFADRDHVAHVPYVDVATVDKDNYGRIRSVLPGVKVRREAALFRNSDLADAISWLRRKC